MALQKTALLLATIIIAFSTIPCLAADYDPNLVFNIDLMLVEIPNQQLSPVSKLDAKRVLLLAADGEMSTVITRQYASIRNYNNQKIDVAHARYNRDKVKTSSEINAVKQRGVDYIEIHLQFGSEWLKSYDPNIAATPITFFTKVDFAAKPSKPVIVAAAKSKTGMLYLIATVEEAKP